MNPRKPTNHRDGEPQEDSEPQKDDNPLEDDLDDSRGIEGALSEIYTFSEELGNALLISRVAVRASSTASTFTVKLDIDQRWEWRDAFLSFSVSGISDSRYHVICDVCD